MMISIWLSYHTLNYQLSCCTDDDGRLGASMDSDKVDLAVLVRNGFHSVALAT